MLHAVILAGGSGTRFWPESRRQLPKQFLSLGGDRTLLQQTLDRCRPWLPLERIWVVTNAMYGDLVAEHLPELPASQVLMEPCSRNTAPCLGLAALVLQHRDPDATLLVLPADHMIAPDHLFQQAGEAAAEWVSQFPGQSVLFGISPRHPATGFGYIRRGARLDSPTALATYSVERFCEKPDLTTAIEFTKSGEYYWNCGIFAWRAAHLLRLLAEHQPVIYERLLGLAEALGNSHWEAALATGYAEMPSISIDHGVLEKARDVVVLEAPFTWDDVGSWHALSRLVGPDPAGNSVLGQHCGLDTHNCIIRSSDRHLVATIGLEDCIVVHTGDVTLVARKDDENAMRRLVELLGQQGYDTYL